QEIRKRSTDVDASYPPHAPSPRSLQILEVIRRQFISIQTIEALSRRQGRWQGLGGCQSMAGARAIARGASAGARASAFAGAAGETGERLLGGRLLARLCAFLTWIELTCVSRKFLLLR